MKENQRNFVEYQLKYKKIREILEKVKKNERNFDESNLVQKEIRVT